MLVAIQVLVKSCPSLLLQVLSPGMLSTLEWCTKVEDITSTYAKEILEALSGFLLARNIQHRITIYDTTNSPNIIFLRPQDPFPPELISSLVSLLVTQEDFVPSIKPPELLEDYYDFF